MKRTIKLLPQQIKILESLPEQGMGYQLVDIELKNGQQLKERVIINATYLQLMDEETLNLEDIVDLKLHGSEPNSTR